MAQRKSEAIRYGDSIPLRQFAPDLPHRLDGGGDGLVHRVLNPLHRGQCERFLFRCDRLSVHEALEVGEDDFATAEDAFKAAAAADPKLAERLWNSRDPARFAFNQGKKLIEQQETAAQASDPAAMRAQIKAERMAELGLAPAAAAPAQPAASRSAPAPAAPRPAVPRSLAGARSAPPRKAEAAQPARRSLTDLYDA